MRLLAIWTITVVFFPLTVIALAVYFILEKAKGVHFDVDGFCDSKINERKMT